MNRFIRCAAACAAFVVPALLALAPSPPGDASGAETPPLVQLPPVFALHGTRVAVTATASGSPDGLSLVVSGRRHRMRPDATGAWHGVFRATHRLTHYRVEARYPNGRMVRSRAGAVTALDEITSPRISFATSSPALVLTLAIGHDVGATDASQAARILPASFDVDEPTGRIDVLDQVNARVVTFDPSGQRVAATPIASTTANDIIREQDGTHLVFDAPRGEITHLTPEGRTTTPANVGEQPANARLTDVPGAASMSSAARRRRPGLRAVLDRGSVLVANGRRGVRIDLGRPALDVVESETDAGGVLWSLVDLDDASMRLVSVDPAHPDDVTTRTVDASVFGDVSRRMVALRSGVVVMNASNTLMTFTRYSR